MTERDRELLRQKKIEARKKEIRKHCIMVVSSVLIFLLCVTVVWMAVKSGKSKKQEAVTAEETTTTEMLAEPEEETQKQAESIQLSSNTKSSYDVPGWQVSDSGWWYQDAATTYFANGWQTIDDKTYYFNEHGYMATGWITVDGEDYYFSESGEYQPDVVPKMVAMTFDDGPSKSTDHLLDILSENNSKATFFMVGTQIEEYPDTVVKMHDLGMQLGNHTWDHTYLNKSTPSEMYSKFAQVDQKLLELTGEESSVYRSPGGGESDEYRAGISRPLILWNVDTLDWKNKDVQMNIAAVLDNADDGDIILMHDLYSQTVEACETIIPELRKRGFKLVTVQELAEAKGATLEAGVDYFSFAETYVDKTAGQESDT